VNAADWGCPTCGGELMSRPIEPEQWSCTVCGVGFTLVDTRTELGRIQVESALRNLRAPRRLRARRRVAFYLGHTLRLRTLGYLIDYDRDRYRDAATAGRAGMIDS
jgi:hypothetical protein